MQIETNISDTIFTHDSILFPSIPKQVHAILYKYFQVDYEIENGKFVFTVQGHKCFLKILKKNRGVNLTVSRWGGGKINFGEGFYPTFKFPYNTDISSKFEKLFNFITGLQALEDEAQKMPKPAIEEIKKFLTKELSTDYTTINIWEADLFSGIEISFYISTKSEQSAVLFCFDENGAISLFWNRSTERRTPSYTTRDTDTLESAIIGGFRSGIDLDSMKKKIEAIEQLKSKINSFDPTKSPEFMQLLKLKKKGEELVQKFYKLLSVTV